MVNIKTYELWCLECLGKNSLDFSSSPFSLPILLRSRTWATGGALSPPVLPPLFLWLLPLLLLLRWFLSFPLFLFSFALFCCRLLLWVLFSFGRGLFWERTNAGLFFPVISSGYALQGRVQVSQNFNVAGVQISRPQILQDFRSFLSHFCREPPSHGPLLLV